jgi:hypothetical protein
MSPKNMIIEFINTIFIVVLISSCILYFIVGDNFKIFTSFLKLMVPWAFFAVFFLIRFRKTRSEIKRRKSEDNIDIVLYFNIFDKLAFEIIIFFIPIFLSLLIYRARGSLDMFDISLLIIVFLIMFSWHNYIFGKER